MLNRRIIARIDVKNENVIKGIHLEGLRVVGDPNQMALKYYSQGIDEIIFMDAVASYYDRNSLSAILRAACNNIFVPITLGGGIRTVQDIRAALNSGADKVAINTQAIKDPDFINRASKIFGSQCLVGSIEAKLIGSNSWEAYYDNGREPSGRDVIAWGVELEKRGIGEVMITSIDVEGTKKGFDTDLLSIMSESLSVPVIASGGCGMCGHLVELMKCTDVSAAAVASVLHYELASVSELKQALKKNNIRVR
mgnify:CR=1 FL=1